MIPMITSQTRALLRRVLAAKSGSTAFRALNEGYTTLYCTLSYTNGEQERIFEAAP